MFFSSNKFFDLMTDCATSNFRGLQLHCVPNTSTPRATCAKASTYTKVSVDKSADKQSKRSSFRAEPRISFNPIEVFPVANSVKIQIFKTQDFCPLKNSIKPISQPQYPTTEHCGCFVCKKMIKTF